MTGVVAFTVVPGTVVVAVTAGVVAVTAGVVAVTSGVVAVTAGVVAVTSGVVAVTSGVVTVTAGTGYVTVGTVVGIVTVSPSGRAVANTFATKKPEIARQTRTTIIVHFTTSTNPNRPKPSSALRIASP